MVPLFVYWRMKAGWQPPGLQEVAVQVGVGSEKVVEVLEEALVVVFAFVLVFVLVLFVFVLATVAIDLVFEELFLVLDFILVVVILV